MPATSATGREKKLMAFRAHQTLGNTVPYGATAGSLFAAGQAAEALLRDWELEKDKFRQVVPKEMLDRLEHPLTRAGDSQVTAVAGE